ncbi:Cystathionine beta-lyase Bsu PatB [Lactiplantibacillus plantarum]|uniref:Cystathionine beta-lyase Bsu PatB n=1 Tax=Lactiplantibacillus plantarum TaxID=1590 RepID=A0A162F3W5_LACPN|nr:Cystathionine beta-lyase Bsu PatB [Lactiplantibacillus plantarum]
MPFDFETVLNRRHTNAVKWDVADDELPMWVADMDFETAPVIKQALIKRAQFGVFGYEEVPMAYYEAWQTGGQRNTTSVRKLSG